MLWFRIGCYALIATGLLHLVGHFQKPVPQDETQKLLLDLMTNYQINIGNETITMMNINKGFSLCFSLLFLWTGTLSIFLSYKLKDYGLLKKVSLINSIALGICTAIGLIYFFSIPNACMAICFISFSVATLRLKAA